MSKRAAAREDTRRRIVEATAKLHGERGVFGTSWRDIAREADVSVATVYSHFPSLEELLPACGAHVMERIRPPRAQDAAAIVGESRDPEERLRRVARELYSYYERGGPHIEVDVRERQIPGMREWEEEQRETVAALVREALARDRPGRRTVTAVSALFDLATFQAHRARGIAVRDAADTVARLAAELAKPHREANRRRKR